MDDVFRRAGVDYPLNTSGADWSKVASALQSEEEIIPPPKNTRRHWWLLLLLLIPWVCNYYTNHSGQETQERVSTTQRSGEEEKSLMKNTGTEEQAVSITSTSLPSQEKEGIGNTFIKAKAQDHVLHQENSVEPVQKNVVPMKEGRLEDLAVAKGAQNNKKQTGASAVRKTSDQSSAGVPLDHAPKKPAREMDINSSQGQINENNKDEAIGLNQKSVLAKDNEDQKLQQNILVEVDSTPHEINEAFVYSEVEVDTINSAPVGPVKVDKNNNKKFYLGIIGGAGYTSVKMQEVKDAGYEYGVIAGYKFNTRLSLEAGVLSSKKNYYSDGKYLDQSKIYLPPNSKITSVLGICRMLEIPVVLQYHFPSVKKASWFASAGVSSFIMKQEDYDYTYLYLSSGNSTVYSYSYKNVSRDWLAVLQLSGGYRFPVQSLFQARLEPYLQLPIKGAGFGKLPLSSAGLRIAITRTIF